MRKSTIRQWLILVLAVPLIGLTGLAWLRVSDASQHLRDVRADASAATTAAEPAALITALTNERNMSSVVILGFDGAMLNLTPILTPEDAAAATDSQVAEFRQVLRDAEPTTRKLYEKALALTVKDTKAVRGDFATMVANEKQGPQYLDNVDVLFTGYTKAIGRLHAVNDTSTAEINDAELHKRAQSVAAQSLITDLDARLIRPVLRQNLKSGTPPVTNRTEVAGDFVLWTDAQEQAVGLLNGTPKSQEIVRRYLERPTQKAFRTELETFIKTGNGSAVQMIDDASAVDEDNPTAPEAWAATREAITARADKLIGQAESQRRSAVLILLGTIVASAAAGYVAARSLVRPLSRVAQGAQELTDVQLPAMVGAVLATPPGEAIVPGELDLLDHAGIAEVDDVIDSLNGMADEAARLAVGQASQLHNAADSLVNVGRRVQGLVSRQIELITGLESDGLELEQIDALLRLDQIASRIRRNADSMIVLAGSQGVTRRSKGDDIPMKRVLTAAIADVEQFERVAINDIDDARLDGRLTTDMTHVIAELTENALSFSPPTEQVQVTGKFLATGEYELAIEDIGIGMTPDEIDVANSRLRGEISFGTEPTRFLGHWVVGAIASRQGFHVTLEVNRHRGITARIRLPETTVTDSRDEQRDHQEAPVALGTLSFHDVISDRRSFDTLVR